MHGFVEDKDKASAAEIKSALVKHSRVLCSLDERREIEANFFLSQIGETGEKRLQDLVLSALPTARSGGVEQSSRCSASFGGGHSLPVRRGEIAEACRQSCSGWTPWS